MPAAAYTRPLTTRSKRKLVSAISTTSAAVDGWSASQSRGEPRKTARSGSGSESGSIAIGSPIRTRQIARRRVRCVLRLRDDHPPFEQLDLVVLAVLAEEAEIDQPTVFQAGPAAGAHERLAHGTTVSARGGDVNVHRMMRRRGSVYCMGL